jgi:hypothetical protein
MANAKITALAEGTVLASTDLLYVVVNPGTSPVSKKATIETVVSAAGTVAVEAVTTTGNAVFAGGTITLGTIVVARGTNRPVAGTWHAGDILFNSAPAAGTVTGWICTVGGTAGGSWLGFGTL